jgi:hypothetical protein
VNDGLSDKTLQCVACPRTFIFTARDQRFFLERGFDPPKRCKPCRDAKKAKYEQREAR